MVVWVGTGAVKHVGGVPMHRGCGQILGLGPRDTNFLAVQNSTGDRNAVGGSAWVSASTGALVLAYEYQPAAAPSRGEPGFTVRDEDTEKSKESKIT